MGYFDKCVPHWYDHSKVTCTTIAFIVEINMQKSLNLYYLRSHLNYHSFRSVMHCLH